MRRKIKACLSITNLLILLILVTILFLRIYKVEALMGFYYDQGRDALVIWRLWHEGRLFLIGPVSGLAGIYLGPFYYYLIAPFYLLGWGNPVYPAVWLAILATIGSFMVYFLGLKMHSKIAGYLGLIISGFSFYIVTSARWLANPTPILLTSMLLLWAMWEIVNKKKSYWWIIATSLIGISLQLESASAFFYLPLFLVFIIWQRKNLPTKKYIYWSIAIFLATLIPQILFNFRHDNLLFDNLKRVLIDEKSFRPNFWDVLNKRVDYFWTAAYSKVIPGRPIESGIFILLSVFGLLAAGEKLKKGLTLLLIFLGAPVVGITFFQGNFGNIYDYYLTGYYLPFILLMSIGLAMVWKLKFGKLILLIFFLLFFRTNISMLKNYYVSAGLPAENEITLGKEIEAVNWVFQDAGGREFNVDVYVPPIIPFSYDYLFLWQGTEKCGANLCGLVKDKQLPLLYTLDEGIAGDWGRHFAWLTRQDGIGRVEETVKFGGISVQRRTRIIK